MERNPLVRSTPDSPLHETTLYPGPRLRGVPGVYGVAEEIVVRDASGERRYSRPALDTLAGHYAGRTVSVRQVMDEVRIGVVDVSIDPRQPLAAYAVRDLLLACVAMGKATLDDTCAEPYFTLEPWRE